MKKIIVEAGYGARLCVDCTPEVLAALATARVVDEKYENSGYVLCESEQKLKITIIDESEIKPFKPSEEAIKRKLTAERDALNTKLAEFDKATTS